MGQTLRLARLLYCVVLLMRSLSGEEPTWRRRKTCAPYLREEEGDGEREGAGVSMSSRREEVVSVSLMGAS